MATAEQIVNRLARDLVPLLQRFADTGELSE